MLFRSGRALAQRFGHRTILAVPLLREGKPVGIICAFRFKVRPFPAQQITLLETFASQAVIAIENVRLFKELQERNKDLGEALERQTATADILRVISQAQTDVQPVFEAIADGAVRLCDAAFCRMFRFDGEQIHFVAHAGLNAEELEGSRRIFPQRAVPGATGVSRAALNRTVVHIADVRTDAEWQSFDVSRSLNPLSGYRTFLAVP